MQSCLSCKARKLRSGLDPHYSASLAGPEYRGRSGEAVTRTIATSINTVTLLVEIYCLTCLREIAGFQAFSSFRIDRQMVPDGYTFGWKRGGSNLPEVVSESEIVQLGVRQAYTWAVWQGILEVTICSDTGSTCIHRLTIRECHDDLVHASFPWSLSLVFAIQSDWFSKHKKDTRRLPSPFLELRHPRPTGSMSHPPYVVLRRSPVVNDVPSASKLLVRWVDALRQLRRLPRPEVTYEGMIFSPLLSLFSQTHSTDWRIWYESSGDDSGRTGWLRFNCLIPMITTMLPYDLTWFLLVRPSALLPSV